jgi:hypothetical protein
LHSRLLIIEAESALIDNFLQTVARLPLMFTCLRCDTARKILFVGTKSQIVRVSRVSYPQTSLLDEQARCPRNARQG